jgi:hypothetical protein
MRLHEIRSKELMERLNTGVNLTLVESILVPEVEKAFNDWIANASGEWLLIGGIVVGLYSKPRTTTDIDVLYNTASSIPAAVNKFKKHRNLAFQHNDTHVEVETVAPENINLPPGLFNQLYKTSVVGSTGVRYPSVSGMIALKVMRGSHQDIADIDAMKQKHKDASVTGFDVPEDKVKAAEDKLGYTLR